MRKFDRFAVMLIPVLALSFQLSAQNNFFSSTKEGDIPAARGPVNYCLHGCKIGDLIIW